MVEVKVEITTIIRKTDIMIEILNTKIIELKTKNDLNITPEEIKNRIEIIKSQRSLLQKQNKLIKKYIEKNPLKCS